MREILFRGKRKEFPGGWVYGWYQPPVKWGSHNYGTSIAVFCDEGWLDDIEVIHETVGQFTGLTDKNGKKIFEGDIVDCWSEGVNAKGTVQQRKDGLWIIYPAWQKTIMWGLCPDESCHTTVEVIGNIHDNPELLEDSQ